MLRHFIFCQIVTIIAIDIIFNKNIFSFVETLHYKHSIALIIYPTLILLITIFIFFLLTLLKEIIKALRRNK